MLSPQITPSPWSCLPTAFAMVLNVPIHDLIGQIGHDGSKIIESFKELPEPYCRCSFHIQELIDCCLEYGYAVIPIEALPVSSPKEGYGYLPFTSHQADLRFYKHLMGRRGVITGISVTSIPHAIAWDCTIGLDPKNGQYIQRSDFIPQTFYWVTRIEQSNPE